MYQYFVSFYCLKTFLCINMLHLSSVDGHLNFFVFWLVDNAAMNIHVQAFAWAYVLLSLGYIPGRRIAR